MPSSPENETRIITESSLSSPPSLIKFVHSTNQLTSASPQPTSNESAVAKPKSTTTPATPFPTSDTSPNDEAIATGVLRRLRTWTRGKLGQLLSKDGFCQACDPACKVSHLTSKLVFHLLAFHCEWLRDALFPTFTASPPPKALAHAELGVVTIALSNIESPALIEVTSDDVAQWPRAGVRDFDIPQTPFPKDSKMRAFLKETDSFLEKTRLSLKGRVRVRCSVFYSYFINVD